ncbi:hypothetical protein SNE40_007011 [Patella caerulea]|uniref:Uncharacterized protein n=1 Tax=Patella caerulea TaxID=87958 RepID=A0AAN8JT19_PATCE
MLSKKRNRRLFNSQPTTPGNAALHVSDCYSLLPSAIQDFKKGHIFHLLISNQRHVGSVQKILEALSGIPVSFYCISTVLESLENYRKLTDQVEFETFEKDCKEDFVYGNLKPKSCVVTRPSNSYVPCSFRTYCVSSYAISSTNKTVMR